MAISPRRRGRGGVLGVGSFEVDCPWEEEGQEADGLTEVPRGRPSQAVSHGPHTGFAQGFSSSLWLDFFSPFLTKTSQHLLCLLSRKEKWSPSS